MQILEDGYDLAKRHDPEEDQAASAEAQATTDAQHEVEGQRQRRRPGCRLPRRSSKEVMEIERSLWGDSD